MLRQPFSLLGKYRDLVLAITLFLILDIGVLGFNFFTSRLIETDTARINTAGELRMYSQQLAKAILSLSHEIANEQPTQTSLAQISEAHTSFVDSLRRLDEGLSASSQEGVIFATSAVADAQEKIAALRKTWEPLGREAAILAAVQDGKITNIDAASSEVFARNVKIMQQAGELTEILEGSALQRASSMRQIQLVAITLAFLNFLFIIFKFVRQLRTSDRQAEDARNETTRILATVQEGLFLLDRQGHIGAQRSSSLTTLLDSRIPPGLNFLDLLAERIDSEHHESAREFIDILFNKKVKPSLMKQLNPLREIAYTRGNGEVSHLDFEFDQVRENDAVSHLLVSVFDVTAKITLQRDLADAEQRAKTEVEALLAVLEQDPATIDAFLRGTEAKLAEINSDLASVQPDAGEYKRLIDKLGRVAHGIKGEAAALGLRTIEKDIHAFENIIDPLRRRIDLGGEDFIPVAVALNEVHEATAKVWRVINRVIHFADGKQPDARQSRDELRELLDQIEQLTVRVAHDLNKKARLKVQAPTGVSLPASILGFLRTTLPQLVRNAVAHGIEPGEERQRLGKPAEGHITCTIDIDDEGDLHVAVQDDGRGLSPAVLRQALVSRGLIDAEALAAMSDQQVVSAMLFEPGFSSLDEAHIHAGRGDGLAVVKEEVNKFGGKLNIASRPERYTRFSVRLNKESWQCA